MLVDLTRTMATQVCAGCSRTNEIPVEELLAGQTLGDPGSIVLPACPQCGSTETLFRNSPPSNNFGALVNRLHARLKVAGQTCTGFPGDDEDAEDMAPDDDTITVTQ